MGKALYRKYRSKSLSEIVGQEHITKTLSNSLKNGSVSHAYLFTGPHGVGKTSIARILAHEVNGFPYNEKQQPVDVIEIDAASNRRIDEMRDLRDRVSIAPVAGKYKVYIVDEVHMLTREAFNALLKTLEEPPAHVIFILATTEAHKLPQTIISRTQRHTFKPIEQNQVIKHLKFIAEKENITITDKALELIAQHGQGSFRDSISLLDQISQHNKKINEEIIYELLGVPPETAIESLVLALNKSPEEIFDELTKMREKGYEAGKIASQLSKEIRKELITPLHLKTDKAKLLACMQSLLAIPGAPDPYAALEIVLLEVYFAGNPIGNDTVAKSKTTKVMPEAVSVIQPSVQESVERPKRKITKSLEEKIDTVENFDWDQCLNEIKKKYNTLYGVLKMARSEQTDGTLTLYFKYSFHQKKIADSKHKKLISDIILRQCNQSIKVETSLEAKTTESPLNKPSSISQIEQPVTNIDTISNIFGGAEVLE